MKKFMLCCFVAASMLLTFSPLQSSASNIVTPKSEVVSTSAEALQAKNLVLRLNEIKHMDKTNLNPKDKNILRNEVITIQNKLSTIGGGVYLSAGAIILIVILLIILL